MSRRAKVELSFVFLLGTLSLVFGVVRLYFVTYRFAVFLDPSKSSSDTDTLPTFWTAAEVSIGLLSACLPPLKPLLAKIGGPIKHSLVSLRAGRTKQSERLSSVENIAKIHGFKEINLEAARGADYETSDYDRVEAAKDAGI